LRVTHFQVKRITKAGTFRFGGKKLLYLANAMVDQDIGLKRPPKASGRSTSPHPAGDIRRTGPLTTSSPVA
jgi:hypothetical protein